MIEQTIAQIEDRIRKSATLSEERRQELLELVDHLRAEMNDVSTTHREAAESIAGHADRSMAAATASAEENELRTALENLSSSVSDFEKTHPKLVQVVNRICVSLANLGI